MYRTLLSTGLHSKESEYDQEVYTSWIVRGAEKKRCRAALTLCMHPQELGWTAAPSAVVQWPAAGMDACAAGALQPIGHEGSAMRGVKWVVSSSSTSLQRSLRTCIGMEPTGANSLWISA